MSVAKPGPSPKATGRSVGRRRYTGASRVPHGNFILPNLPDTRCTLSNDVTRGRGMYKGTIIPIVLVLGIIVAGAAAILFVLNLGSESSTARAMKADEPDGRAGTFSAGARVALRDFIQAQGYKCPNVSDGTPTGDRAEAIHVRCDNDLQFKVTPQGGMFLVAPWK